MEHESGLNPARIQSDLAFNPSIAYNASLGGYGIGLGQWDSGRRVNLLNFAKVKKGMGISSFTNGFCVE